ncbi:hypothetical protein [Paenibacillus campi]|uniref:hypothetical protein n=1 Tax=Paenibacillus campi TaxID=3106031 RepID=UPI002AFF6DF1|nr:hypothetical protein [Paenibacillus sp. SGZ-1009]
MNTMPLALLMSCGGLFVLFVLAIVVLPKLQRRENRDYQVERILDEGYAAQGLILDVIPSGRYHSGQPELQLRLRIESRTRLPVEAIATVTVYSMNRGRFQEGIRVPVRVLETRTGLRIAVKGTVDYP